MKKLNWQVVSGTELSQLLTQSSLEESGAVGSATVYHLSHDGQEKIAISLPDGQVMLVEPGDVNKPRRRRLESRLG